MIGGPCSNKVNEYRTIVFDIDTIDEDFQKDMDAALNKNAQDGFTIHTVTSNMVLMWKDAE